MQERIQIPKQRRASREEYILSDEETYAAQSHHQTIDHETDSVLAHIDEALYGGGEDDDAAIEAVEIHYAAGSLAVAAAA